MNPSTFRFLAASLLLLLSACAVPPPAPPQSPLEQDVDKITEQLIQDWRAHRALPMPLARLFPKAVVVGWVIDQRAGAKVTDFAMPQSQAAEKARGFLTQYLASQAPDVRVIEAESPNNTGTGLMLSGQLTPPGPNTPQRLTLALLDAQTGEIRARAQGAVRATATDAFPTRLDAESPVLVNETAARIEIAKSLLGPLPNTPISPPSRQTLAADAWLGEAQQAYAAGHYDVAQTLFERAAAQPSVDAIRAYNGLYLSRVQLGQQVAAMDAFRHLVAEGMRTNMLGVKLLFTPGETEFLADPTVRSAYDSWLQVIATQASTSSTCMNVVGHTSHTGAETFNQELSLQRSERVRDLLQGKVPSLVPRLGVIGKGWTENIVGSGTDDARDAVDRRVEFRIVACRG